MESPSSKRAKIGDAVYPSSSNSNSQIIPLGTSDFKQVIKSAVFMDKTMLIKALLEDFPVMRITVPRHFGKTTNLSMLKYFFEMQLSTNGKRLSKAKCFDPVKDTSNYELFVKNNLEITKHTDIMEEHFGKYPIVYADFKCNVVIKTFDDALDFSRTVIHKTFKEHKYLIKSKKIRSDQREYCKRWYDDTYKCLNECEVFGALDFLAECLFDHHNKKCVVLIDEYDSLVEKAIFTAVNGNLLYRIIRFNMKMLADFFEGNTYIARSTILGVTGIHLEIRLCFSPNYLDYFSFLEEHCYLDFFGLTEKEVLSLFDNPLFNLDSNLKERALSYYRGYSTAVRTTLYSFWSVFHFLQRKKIRNYWKSSGILFNLQKVLKIGVRRTEIESLLYGGSMKITIDNCISQSDFVALSNLIRKSSIMYSDTFYSFLFGQGILGINADLEVDFDQFFLKIPNDEIKEYLYQQLIQYYYTLITNLAAKQTQECISILDNFSLASITQIEQDLEQFCKILERLFAAFSRYLTICERPLQSLMASILYKTKFRYRPEFCGDYDWVGVLVMEQNFGVIIELQHKQTPRLALQQIIDKKYYEVLRSRNVDKCVLIGINVTEDLKVSVSYLITNPCVDDIDVNEAKDLPL